MGILLQKLSFQKTLDQDTSPENLDPQSYTDGLNIQPLTNDSESTTSHIPVLGNAEVFSLGSVAVQNKTWRIHSPQDASNTLGGIFLYDQNGNLFPTISGQVQPMEWNRNQTVANQVTAILAMFTTIDGSGTTVVTAAGDYIDITTNTIAGYELGLNAKTAGHATPILITDTSLDPVVMAEAYDVSLTGELNDIGAKYLFGDLFILSTPQKNLPQTLKYYSNGTNPVNAIASVVASGGRYSVITAQPHGLTTGTKIIISGIVYTGTPIVSPNGIWIITSTGSLTFTCEEWYAVTTGYTAWSSGGIITVYTESIGEIGVAQKDVNTSVWTYTRLLRTKQWNFRTAKQADFRVAERTSIKDSLYWTNNYEVPRCFYYNRPLNGIFVDAAYNSTTDTGDRDGAITQINPHGHYSYLTVAEETKLLLSPTGMRVQFTDQPQSGGQVASGNWRYTIRGVSDSLAFTEWLDLTNPVNVYSASNNGDPTLIIGDAPGTITPKINNLQITGILPGLFKYIELAGVNYVGAAIEGFIIKRVLLDGVSSTLALSHTGTETGSTNLDLGTLNTKFEPIETAKSMNVVDSRMVLSNVTISQQKDFNLWTQTFKHTINRQSIDAVQNNITGTLKMGEYQDPINVNTRAGLMHNEIYRFGLKVRFKKSGFWSDDFWIDDIAINCETTNIDLVTGLPVSSDPTRRVAGLTSFDLTDGVFAPPSTVTSVYTSYISFSNIDFDFLVDGVRVRDLIDTISIERAEVINPLITTSGIAVPSITNAFVDVGANYINLYSNPSVTAIGEFPFISGRTAAGGSTANPQYNDAEFAGTIFRTVVALYSPDLRFGHTSISAFQSQNGDIMINHGNPSYVGFNNGYTSVAASNVASNYSQYSGYVATTRTNPPSLIPIQEAINVSYGATGLFTISNKTYYKKSALYVNASLDHYSINHIAGTPVFESPVANPFGLISGQTNDGGFYYNQYYKPRTDPYGDKNLTKYVTCGHFFSITADMTGSQSTDVYGGDTFTQLSYFKHRVAAHGVNEAFPGLSTPTAELTGFGGGFSFYSQNRINSQMRQKSTTQIGALYPGIDTANWLTTFTNTDNNFGEGYQEGYTIRNQIQSDIAFDPNAEQINVLPATFFYSGIKILDSSQDGYRSILPLNRHDLDITFGEITHHEIFNGELFALQQLKVEREFFNARGQMQSDPDLKIVIGDGSIMSRDGQTITNYGTSHKWSVVKGKSIGGNETLYWIDIISKKVFRLASDGTISLSDIKGMKSFFANNLQWIFGKDTPANGTGISSVWHDRFSQAIWTVRGHRITPFMWVHGAIFPIPTIIGNLFYYHPIPQPPPEFVYSTFEETGELFISKFTGSHNIDPVAVYPLPNVISTLTGTTTLTITTASPHLLVTGDQVKFRNISGLSTDINETFFTITKTGASAFTVTVAALTNAYVASSGSIVDVNPKYWTFIPHTDNRYYNEYTIVYNELKGGFTTFLTPKPLIYNQWQDSYLTPRPISNTHLLYEENTGTELTWYDQPHATPQSQTERGFIEGVVNRGNEETFWMIALRAISDIVPIRFEFKTKTQESYLNSSEMRAREDYFESPVKNDSTITITNPTGLNSLNTSKLFGRWVKIKMYFEIGVYQRLVNILTKVNTSTRSINK